MSTVPEAGDRGTPLGDAAAWGQAVRARLDELGGSLAWLGRETARAEGRERAYAQSTVTGWLLGDYDPQPAAVFAMERALGVRAGSLSRLLGYLPTDARPAVGVEAAIMSEGRLSEQDRDLLLFILRQRLAVSAGPADR